MKSDVAHSSASVSVTVSPEMTAVLDGNPIHPVYSTFWLAYHAEVAARRAIQGFFEPGENAVGGAIELRHIGMVAVGSVVCITATVTRVALPKIVCSIEASTGNRLFATGTQTQIVLPQQRIAELIKECYGQQTEE